MPCHPARARELLRNRKAAVYRTYPFTIILKNREGGEVQPVAVKVDPGSKITGLAVVADQGRGKTVVFAAEIEHRGLRIKAALESRRLHRRGRRYRKTRYRKPRFLNRTRSKGWLPPSLQSRVENVVTWIRRLSRLVPLALISQEIVRFDMQKIDNPEISGTAYQQGTLAGYEVREYLLEKFHRTCAYCKKTGVPLQVEHITPKSRGGSDLVDNLTIACGPCNQRKGNQTVGEFGHPEVQRQAKAPLRDAAAVNATRRVLHERLKAFRCPVECGSGGRTKFNRVQQSYLKAHWIDAACVGVSGGLVRLNPKQVVLIIKATGHGKRQRCNTNKYGFPIHHAPISKSFMGFQTGDIAKAVIPIGKNKGKHKGRIVIRHRPYFQIERVDVHPKNVIKLHCSDGYCYYD